MTTFNSRLSSVFVVFVTNLLCLPAFPADPSAKPDATDVRKSVLIFRRADELYKKDRFDEAETEFRAALAFSEKINGPQDPITFGSMIGLAGCLKKQNKLEEAMKVATDMIERVRKDYGPEHEFRKSAEEAYAEIVNQAANLLYRRSYAAFERKDHEEAERLALESEKRGRAQAIDKSLILRALDMAGICALELGNPTRALKHFTNAAALTDKSVDALEWARAQFQVARAYQAGTQYTNAEQILALILPTHIAKLGSDHPDTIRVRTELVFVVAHQNRYEEAEPLCRGLVQTQERVRGPEHRDTLRTRIELAIILYSRRKFGPAEDEYRAILKTMDRVFGAEDSETLGVVYNLALCLSEQGKNEEAKGLARRSLDGRKKVFGTENTDTKASQRLFDRLTSKK